MGDGGVVDEVLISKLDASNPLYLHPSDSSTLTIVNFQLKGTENYSVWSNAMKLALQVKNKLGFVTGKCIKPTESEVLANQWDRCNSVVLTWILNSVSEELYVGQVYSKNAFEVWEDLRDTYDKVDGSVIFNLYQKINLLNQNGSTVSEYYHRLTTLWKQFDAMVQLPSCSCQASKEFNDFNHLIKLMQFLMGLDDVYQPVRTNLLTREPLPTVKVAFSIVSREESHRISSGFSKNQSQHVGFVSKNLQSFDSKKRFNRGPNPNLKCEHCNKIGHTIERCFELVGYPQSNKTKTGLRSSVSNNSNPSKGFTSNPSKGSTSNSTASSLTPEQVSQLLGLLHEKSGDSLQRSNVGGNYMSNFSSFSLSKNTFCFNSNISSSNSPGWVIDSGANQHMVMNDQNIFDAVDVSELNICVKHPNGSNANVTKIGNFKLNNDVILTDVFVVPDYYVNLLSVYKLARDNKLSVLFNEKNCYIQDLHTKKILVTGSQVDGLYICGESSSSFKICFNSFDQINMWHSRLGHPSHHVLNVLKNDLKIQTVNSLYPCEVCQMAKQKREPFPLSDHKTSRVGELVHLDVWGPYRVQSKEGYRYFLTIVDDFSRAVWVYLLNNKGEVFYNIQTFFNMITNQFDVNIKTFRSDNGSEFVNSQMETFLRNNGIIHQTSCTHTPQQNGIVERKHQHLLNVARSLLFESNVPLKFWSECVLTATYLINRTPSSVLNGRSPYEKLFGFKPSLNHLRNFGCLCFSKVLNSSNKFESRSTKCVFLGYSNNKKGYKLWDINKKQVLISRDVKFYESIYPFKNSELSKEIDLQTDDTVNNQNFFNHYLFSDTEVLASEKISNDEEGDALNVATVEQPPSSSSMSDGMAGSQQPSGHENSSSEVVSEVEFNDETSSPEGNFDNNEPISVRRSTRTSCLPKKLQEYVIEGKVKYGLEKVLNYSNLSFENMCFISVLNKSVEPRNFKEAFMDNNWVNAMNEEMSALNGNNTWDIVDLPNGRKPIGCKWVYKIKYKSNGEIERFKARLVAKGFNQREGIDFDETFSPVVKMVTVRTVISLAVKKDWPLYQLDVNNAFLYGDLQEEVYMTLPEGYFSKDDKKVCRLKKSLYGLKQAPRMWNQKLVSVLLNQGFKQSKNDYSLFIKSVNDILIVLLVYVDDIVITGNSVKEIEKVKSLLKTSFMIKDLGLLKYFLGIEVLRTGSGICLSQRKYCVDLLAEFGLTASKPVNTPIDQNYVVNNVCKKDESLLNDISVYQKLIGKLIYLSHTRPDISYSVQFLSQYMHSPTHAHLQLAFRLLRYLKRSPGKGVLLSKSGSFELSAYADSDWAKCLSSRRSVTGFCVFFGSSLISWKSKKQATVSRSSAEAEFRAMCAASSEVIWIMNLLKELKVVVKLPVALFCDNTAAIAISANPVFHDRTKHFEVDLFYLRERIAAGVINVIQTKTDDQLADLFTKDLLMVQHLMISTCQTAP